MNKNSLGWTDVRAKLPLEENIFVFSPATRLKLPENISPEDLEDFFQTAMDQKLLHAGNLNYRYNPKEENLWWKYVGCNAPIRFKSMWRDEQLENWGVQTYFFCSQCGFRIGSRLSVGEFSRLIFHLMMKNVMPELNMGNVINPTYNMSWRISFSREDSEILKTGKYDPAKCDVAPPPCFRPGFVPTTDPSRFEFFIESHIWLKFLFLKYKENTDNLLKEISRAIRGPRRK